MRVPALKFALRPSSLAGLVFSLMMLLMPGFGRGQTSASPAVAPVATRLTHPIDEAQLVSVKGTVHRLANAANDRGAAPDGMSLGRIHLVMKRSAAQEADLQQLIQDMHTPGTAAYHKWLTPDQFGQRFGPSDADVATLTAWLGKHGLSVSKVLAGRQVLEVTGNVGQFREAFHTQIHKYQVNGQTRYANATDPQIPAALAPVLGGFSSLNNFPLKSDMKLNGTAMYDPATHKATPNWTYTGTSPITFPIAPGDFAVQYDLNPLYTAGTKGAGQTIGIINESNINPTLVAEYRSLFGLPASTVNVIIDGNDPGIDGVNNPDGPNGAAGEAYLDVEISGSVAPLAQIDLVIAGDTALENGLILAAEHAVYADVAPVLSLSFSGCEGGQGAFFNAEISNLWEEAAAQGQTVMVSSGDSGSAGCDNPDSQQYAVYGQAVNGLGSTPYNVSVGGTDFYYSSYSSGDGTTINSTENAQIDQAWNTSASAQTATPTTSLQAPLPEQPWNDSQYGLNLLNQYAAGDGTTIAGGGGGASNCATGTPATYEYTGGSCKGYLKPSWQTGAGVPNDSVRDVPDLSLFAANGANLTYYPICAADGDCNTANDGTGPVRISGVGGTSASTPAFAGIMALVNEKYGAQGQAGFVLYPLATQFPSAFHDVVNGTNSVPCSYNPASPNCIAVTGAVTLTGSSTTVEGEIGTGTTAEYNATAGYDPASGLGTIDAANLVNNWGNVKFTGSTVTLTPSQTMFTHGTAITVSGAVTPGTAAGSVALKTTSTEPLQAAQGASTLYTGGSPTFTVSGGTYSGTVNSLPGGTYNIFGAYSGDGTNAASTSTPVSITVAPEASSVIFEGLNQIQQALTSGKSIPYGTQVLLSGEAVPTSFYTTCVVSSPPSSCSTATFTEPTGTVTFADNGTTLNTAAVNAEGDAEYNAPFALGSHSVTASYSGDNSYNPSTSSALTFTVTQDVPDINSQTSYSSFAAPGMAQAATGQETLIIEVSNSANDNTLNYVNGTFVPVAPPTGTVTVTGLGSSPITATLQPAVDASPIPGNGNTSLEEGIAVIPVPAGISGGNYTVSISYAGDTNYEAISTGNFTEQVGTYSGASTTTSATANQTATSATTLTTISATVTGSGNNGSPTGFVFLVSPGGYFVTSAGLTAGSGNTSTATMAVTSENLIEGTNELTVEYAPAQNSPYAPSGTTLTIQNGAYAVTATPSIALTNSGGITTTAGSSGMSTITVTPAGGFTGAVALTCAVTPTTGTSVPTCTISNATISGTTAATSTLTVVTSATTTTGNYTVTVTGTAAGVTTATTTVPLTVNAAAVTPTIALSNSGSITLPAAGGSGTSTISVTPAGGFTGSVALSCAVTPTTGTSVPTCSVVTPVSITGSAPATALLTVTSTSTTTAGAYMVSVSASATGVATPTPTVVSVTVTAPAPTISLSNSGSISIATPGGMGTSTITATLGNGLAASGVSLSCAVSPTTENDPPTCSLSTLTATSGSSTSATATLTVNTTAATTGAMQKPRLGLLPIGGGVAMAGLLFLVMPVRRRRWTTLLGAIVLMAAVGFSAGCGGGTVQTPSNPGTTAGTYTVTVTGTASGATAATTTVSVTVQ